LAYMKVQSLLSGAVNSKVVRGFIDALIILVLFFAIIQLPAFVVYNGHDAGSQAATEYWTIHGFQYGRDIVQNVGPLGFLAYPRIFTGFLDWPKLLITILLVLYLAFLLFISSRCLPVTIRIIFLIFAAFFCATDVTFYLLLLMVAYQLMYTNKLWMVVLAILVLALLSLTKMTILFIALFIIIASIVNSILWRRYVFAASTMAGFVIFLLAIWNISGQSMANFPSFLYGAAAFSSGYNEAMTIYESGMIRALGAVVLAGSMVPILWRALSSLLKIRNNIPAVGRQLLLAGIELFILFVVWKHGFVRADGHVVIFFIYVLVSSMWILFRRDPRGYGTEDSTHNLPLKFSIPLGIILIVAAFMGLSNAPEKMVVAKYYEIDRARLVFANIPEYFRKLNIQLNENIEKMQLPKTRALAGGQTVSYFGMSPAPIIYNGLNFISTPSTISFASWNKEIMEADAQFFRDDIQAPAYLVFDLNTIDGRLVAQDSSLAQLEILHRYEVAGFEAGHLILHRIKGKQPLSKVTILECEYNIGDWIDVPLDTHNPLWVKIDIDENPLERLVSLAYKPSIYSIEIVNENSVNSIYKFIPTMAETGFMINPLIVDNHDALAARYRGWLQQNTGNSSPAISKVVKFRITCDRGTEALSGGHATISFEEIPGLALGNNDDQHKFYRLEAQLYDFDAELMDYKTPFTVGARAAFGETFYQFHAPSQLKIYKPDGVQKLKAYYALHPDAYEQGGATGGVELKVRLETTGGKDILIFKKNLNPVEVPGDRGEQLLDVDLPSDNGTVLIEINPIKSPAWCQFLIRKLVMQNMNNLSSPLSPEKP